MSRDSRTGSSGSAFTLPWALTLDCTLIYHRWRAEGSSRAQLVPAETSNYQSSKMRDQAVARSITRCAANVELSSCPLPKAHRLPGPYGGDGSFAILLRFFQSSPQSQ